MDYQKKDAYDFFIQFLSESESYKSAIEYLELVYDIKDFDPLTLKIEEN